MGTKRVRCISTNEYLHLTEGKVYDAWDHHDPLYIYVVNDDGVQGRYLSDRFEPVMDNIPDDMKLQGSAKDTQVGGDHYAKLAIQPYEYCTANNIPYIESNAIKYLTRWRDKGGIQDLEKAVHSIQWLIEYEKGKQKNAE